MSLLGEAIRAGFQPCSYSLLILALVVLGLRGERSRIPTFAVYYISATVFAWIPFAGISPSPVVDGRVAGAVALVVGLILAGWKTVGRTTSATAGMAGVAMVGAFAGATWVPCVGPELGSVLTAALSDPGPGLAGLALYLLGVMWVAAVLAGIADYAPPVRRVLEERTSTTVFRILGGLIAVTVAVDLYPLLLSHLARLSSP